MIFIHHQYFKSVFIAFSQVSLHKTTITIKPSHLMSPSQACMHACLHDTQILADILTSAIRFTACMHDAHIFISATLFYWLHKNWNWKSHNNFYNFYSVYVSRFMHTCAKKSTYFSYLIFKRVIKVKSTLKTNAF